MPIIPLRPKDVISPSGNGDDELQLTPYTILYDRESAAAFAENLRDVRSGLLAPTPGSDLDIFVGGVSTNETIFLQLTDQLEQMSRVVSAAKKLYLSPGARRLERSFAELLNRLAVVNNYFSTIVGCKARDDIPLIIRPLRQLLEALRESVQEVTKNASGLSRQDIKVREVRINSANETLIKLMKNLEETVPPRFEEDFKEHLLSGSKKRLVAARERQKILSASSPGHGN